MRVWTLLIAAAVLAMARPAAACQDDTPTGYFSPVGGTALPPDPVIYLFTQPSLHEALEVVDARTGRPLAFDKRLVANPVEDRRWPMVISAAFRVQVFAPAGTVIELRFYGQTTRYPIAGASEAREARIIGVAYERVRRGCDELDALELTTEGNAIAYRIELLPSSNVADAAQTLVVPASWEALYGQRTSPLVTDVAYRIAWGEEERSVPAGFRGVRDLEVYALHADGTEQPLGHGTAALGLRTVRLPTELLARARAPFTPAYARASAPAGRPFAVLCLAALSGVLMGALGVFVWMRRR